MRQLVGLKDAALKLGTASTGFVTDHNRAPLSVSFERIENKVRMQNGAMRKYYRADKRTVAASWTMVPGTSADTVDGNMGAEDVETFYLANKGAFSCTITYGVDSNGDNIDETFQVIFEDFSKELVKRWGEVNLYEMSLTLEEV